MADTLIERFQAFAVQPAAHPEFEAAVLVATAINPELLAESVWGQRAALLAAMAEAGEPQPVWERLLALGFCGNRERYRDIANSAIDQVLATRTGIPISLGAVLIEAARAEGQVAVGINHPGHFLVRVGDTLIDPFSMQPVALAAAEQAAAAQLPGVSGTEFALRMLNNLKYFFSAEQIWDQALAMVDYQLAMVPQHPQLWSEKGEFWRHLGANNAAADAYRQALRHAADAPPELTSKLRARLVSLSSAEPQTVH